MLWQGFCSLWRLVYLCCGKVFAATGCKNLATTKNVCELPQAASSQGFKKLMKPEELE